MRICVTTQQKFFQLLCRVGFKLGSPVPAGTYMDTGYKVSKQRQHFDHCKSENTSQLLLQHPHDLDRFEQLDDAQWLQGAYEIKLVCFGLSRLSGNTDLRERS